MKTRPVTPDMLTINSQAVQRARALLIEMTQGELEMTVVEASMLHGAISTLTVMLDDVPPPTPRR